MFRRSLIAPLAALIAMSVLLAAPAVAQAHERRTVGTYEFVVGWSVEPSYEGEMNGVSLRVQTPGTPATPVEGVEKSVQVEVTHVASKQRVTMPLETVFNSPGLYIAHLLPTEPGQYVFRFFGTINGAQINETFTSGDKFDNINPVGDIQFPVKVAQVREVQGVASDALATADDSDSTASSARTIAFVAIALAVLSGIASGAVVATRRK
jgi:hypothetical protein